MAMFGYDGCRGKGYPVLLVWLVEPEDGRSFRERRRCFQEGAEDCPYVSAGRIGSIADDVEHYIVSVHLHWRC